MQPAGNTILITGGASGIGLALAKAFHDLGNTVIIAGRRKSLLDAMSAANPGVESIAFDVADKNAIPAFAARLTQAHPGLNMLINNAGIMAAEDLAADPVDLAAAEATMATNLLGPIRLTAALLPHLRAQSRATVINVTSGLAFVPRADAPSYSASKAALHSWTLSLRHQLRDTAVEVLELAPPLVNTGISPAVGSNPKPGQSNPPRGVPVDEFVDQAMALLLSSPTPQEILVGRAVVQRNAESDGQFEEVFNMINTVE